MIPERHLIRHRYHRYRFPPEIISHAVWLYHRFYLSVREFEDLLAERGITVSYEATGQWCPNPVPIAFARGEWNCNSRRAGLAAPLVAFCLVCFGLVLAGVGYQRPWLVLFKIGRFTIRKPTTVALGPDVSCGS
jgi:putative transposase